MLYDMRTDLSIRIGGWFGKVLDEITSSMYCVQFGWWMITSPWTPSRRAPCGSRRKTSRDTDCMGVTPTFSIDTLEI